MLVIGVWLLKLTKKSFPRIIIYKRNDILRGSFHQTETRASDARECVSGQAIYDPGGIRGRQNQGREVLLNDYAQQCDRTGCAIL